MNLERPVTPVFARSTLVFALVVAFIALFSLSASAAPRPCRKGSCDKKAPTTPANLTVTGTTDSSISVSWSASTDNVGVTGYGRYLDGSLVSDGSGTSFTFAGLVCGTSHALAIDAFDAAGNRSKMASVTASASACAGGGGGGGGGGGTGTAPPFRFMINSDQGNQAAASYGYNLLDVGSAAQADDLPLGTQGLIWVGDYNNSSCSWEQSDATVRATATAAIGDAKVFGYFFSDEPDPFACPTAYADHRARSNLLKSVDPGHKTVMLIDSNSEQQTLDQIPNWAGAADYFALDPYPCYQSQPCNYSWIDQVAAAADSAGLNYWGTVQAFQDSIWRWPTVDELNHMLAQWAATRQSGMMTFAWSWSGNTLSTQPNLLSALNAFNTGAGAVPAPSPPPADTTAPSTPTGLAATGSTQTSISLSWNASTDNVSVASYGLYKGGSLTGSTSGTSTTFSGLACNTSYQLGVDAVDSAGNRSGKATLTASTSACAASDTTPPSPINGFNATSVTGTTIAVSWLPATDNVGVSGYNLYRNGVKVGSTTTALTFTFAGLTCATSYSLAVEAADAAGNVSNRALSTITSSTAACASASDTVAPSAPTGLAATGSTQTSISLSWNASTDNVAVTGYNVFRGGTQEGTSTTTSYTSGSLSCGTSYTFTVQARDAAGNVSGQSGSLNAGTAACSSGSDPVVTAAGDICGSATDCTPTSNLVLSINPSRALTLGDNAYNDGSLSQFNSEYDPNWGRFKAITSPAPGNHDYHVSGAADYFTYFGSRAPAPYYSFDLGNWHIISLASSSGLDPTAGGAEEAWLKQDLAAHPNKCTLAYWHEPRWSSGTVHGSNSDWADVWNDLYTAKADLVLNGHEHNYERFGKQNPSGASDANGIRELVVGTGGASHGYPFGTPLPNSQVRNDSTWGVLKLTLHPTSYDWQFIPITGSTFTDSGSDTCS